MLVSATLLLCYSILLCLAIYVLTFLLNVFEIYPNYIEHISIAIIIAFAAAAFLITGGILFLLRKKFAYYFSVVGTIFSTISMIMLTFLSILKIWNSVIFGCINVCIILSMLLPFVGLFLAPRQKGLKLAYAGMILSSCGTVILIEYTNMVLKNGIFVGFAIIGFLAFILPAIAVTRATIKGKQLSFELVIFTFMFQAMQFLLICTLCGIVINPPIMLLGIVCVLPITIGGILISKSIEKGFIMVALGLIIFCVWMFLIFLNFGGAILLAAGLTTAGVIIFMCEIFLMRNNNENEIKITKSI